MAGLPDGDRGVRRCLLVLITVCEHGRTETSHNGICVAEATDDYKQHIVVLSYATARDVFKAKIFMTKASTLKAKAWTFEAKAFKHMVRAEIKIHSTSDRMTG